MEKETHVAHAQPACFSLLLSGMQDEELEFFRRFVCRHGGAISPVERQGWYQLDCPPGTQQVPNDERDPQMDETYRLQYPDGAGLIWYRLLMLDGILRANTLLAPAEEDGWPLRGEDGARESNKAPELSGPFENGACA